MKKLGILALSLLGIAMFTACSSDDGDGPAVTISAPSDGSTFSTADTLTLLFVVTDDMDIASIALDAGDLGTGNVGANELSGNDNTQYSGGFTIPAGANTGSYTLTINATDNDGNAGSDSVDITIQ